MGRGWNGAERRVRLKNSAAPESWTVTAVQSLAGAGSLKWRLSAGLAVRLLAAGSARLQPAPVSRGVREVVQDWKKAPAAAANLPPVPTVVRATESLPG
jgi:hypothetical protein